MMRTTVATPANAPTPVTATAPTDLAADSNNNSNFNIVTTLDNSRPDTDTDTSDNGSTNTTLSICTSHSSIAHDNEPEHERVRISPLDASPQVSPIAAPRMDKPEEPPPAPLTDTPRAAPNFQVAQDHHRLLIPDFAYALSDSFDDPLVRLVSRPRRLVSPADNFGDDREHQRRIDPGGSKFEPPGRCKVPVRAGPRTGIDLPCRHLTRPTRPTTSRCDRHHRAFLSSRIVLVSIKRLAQSHPQQQSSN